MVQYCITLCSLPIETDLPFLKFHQAYRFDSRILNENVQLVLTILFDFYKVLCKSKNIYFSSKRTNK